MFSAKKKKKEKKVLLAYKDEKIESHLETFVPYAFHYDKNTIVAKNGELLQIIKISELGLNNEELFSRGYKDLRDLVKTSILKHFKSWHFSFWIHTKRKSSDLDSLIGHPNYKFAKSLHDKWMERYDLKNWHINDLYITILHVPPFGSTFSIQKFLRRCLSFAEYKYTSRFFESSFKKLNSTVDKFLADINWTGAVKLGLVKGKSKTGDLMYFSEPAGFFNSIVYSKDKPFPADVVDISEQIINEASLTLEYNSLKLSSKSDQCHTVMLSLKDNQELPTKSFDDILNLPLNFIITESFNFVPPGDAEKTLEQHKKIVKIMEEESIGKFNPLNELAKKEDDYEFTDTDFGERQIMISLSAETKEEMDNSLRLLISTLKRLGLQILREDIMAEDCYWAQLPGNFEFLKRKYLVTPQQIAGFASLRDFQSGRMLGGYWEKAITYFNTVNETPYFFNFHSGKTGHSLITGSPGSGKTTFQNFLISESSKICKRIFIAEFNERKSEIFVKAMGGNYTLIENNILTQIPKFALGDKENSPLSWPDVMASLSPTLNENIIPESIWTDSCHGISIPSLHLDDSSSPALLNFILYKIYMTLTDKPSIFALSKAIVPLKEFLGTKLFLSMLESFRDKNTVLIFTEDYTDNSLQEALSNVTLSNLPTRFFLPGDYSEESFSKISGLPKKDLPLFEYLSSRYHQIMLIYNQNSAIIEFYLGGMDAELAILSANDETRELAENSINEARTEPEKWLEVFENKLQTIYEN